MSTPESSTRSKVSKWIGIAYVVLVVIAMLDGFGSFMGAIFIYGFLAAIAWAITLFATRSSTVDGSHPPSGPARGESRAVWQATEEAGQTPYGAAQSVPGVATSDGSMTAGAASDPPLTNGERVALKTRFEALPPEMRNMMMARSIVGAAKAVNYYKRGAFSHVIGLSRGAEILDAYDPELAGKFRVLVAKAAAKPHDDHLGSDPLLAPVGQATGPPELVAIWFAERGDFGSARPALEGAFTSVSI